MNYAETVLTWCWWFLDQFDDDLAQLRGFKRINRHRKPIHNLDGIY